MSLPAPWVSRFVAVNFIPGLFILAAYAQAAEMSDSKACIDQCAASTQWTEDLNPECLHHPEGLSRQELKEHIDSCLDARAKREEECVNANCRSCSERCAMAAQWTEDQDGECLHPPEGLAKEEIMERMHSCIQARRKREEECVQAHCGDDEL
eukprot:TRINITY_DN20015_c0_g1_i1.p1 TRINITY_DN20015_c0_g1~~TRINITY_DN20015_c0_g1_i1.p1  ORF type:complete len:153 (+),score=31.15 TRINITY_DN20015_c0_g1_i1:77-535(+)